MTRLTLGAMLLILAGTVGLGYRQFSYYKETQRTTLGPIGVSVREQQTVAVPAWASIAAILVGTVTLLVTRQKPSRA